MKKTSCSSMRGLKLGILVCLVPLGQVARADFIFGEPSKVPNINSSSFDSVPYISSDGLELYFGSTRPHGGDECFCDIWVSRRPTTEDVWSEPVKLDPPVNSDGPEGSPCISPDGLELYFSENFFPRYSGCQLNPNGYGEGDLWVSRRAAKEDPWGEPENLGQTVNSPENEDTPSISADGLSLYFMSNRGEGVNVFVTTRQTEDHPWEPAVKLGYPVNTDYYESVPRISPDGLSLFFSVGGFQTDIYVSRRPTTTDPWRPEVSFDPINSTGNEYALTYAAGCSTLYFARGNDYFDTASYDIWQVEVTPIVDFNGDSALDTLDVLMMVESWGSTTNSLCDIAPLPFGDGVVDVRDLKVLTEYIEPIDRTLIANWAMDETEGITAHDNVSGNDAFALGSPVWQPGGGMVGGAIQLDGVDDYIIAGAVLKSAERPFSVFAWVKDGAPNQVVISQTMSANWLMADAGGKLITELKGSDGSAESLLSQLVITDGYWHEIGLTWDGLHRKLFVDGVAVAEDTQEGLDVRSVGLYIGAGKNAGSGTHWSGLIDDVRIYNRAVQP